MVRRRRAGGDRGAATSGRSEPRPPGAHVLGVQAENRRLPPRPRSPRFANLLETISGGSKLIKRQRRTTRGEGVEKRFAVVYGQTLPTRPRLQSPCRLRGRGLHRFAGPTHRESLDSREAPRDGRVAALVGRVWTSGRRRLEVTQLGGRGRGGREPRAPGSPVRSRAARPRMQEDSLCSRAPCGRGALSPEAFIVA